MPKLLKEYLEGLSKQDSEEIWDWMKKDINALDDMMDILEGNYDGSLKK